MLFAIALLSCIGLLAQTPTPTLNRTQPDQYVYDDPGRCIDGQTIYNLTSHQRKTCDQNGVWQTPSSGGASPAGTGTEAQFRLNSTNLQALANSAIVPAMGKPADLVVVPTCAGTCATTYGYIINVFNGVGFTPDSTEVTVLNAATLDMTHFNTVTFPTIANAKCTISRSTGPTTGILVDTHDCDGSTFPDNTANVDQMQSIPALTVDTTGGVALLGTGFPTSSAGTPILSGLGYVKNLGNFSGSGLNLLANRQNFNAVDGRGRIQSTAYVGVEFLPAIGYYIETDLFQVDEISGNKGVCTDANAIFKPCLSGTSGSIGGGALLAGACASTTVAVTGATTAMAVQASPAGGVDPGAGIYWKARVSSADTVTVDVCAAVGATPSVTTYNVRILQ